MIPVPLGFWTKPYVYAGDPSYSEWYNVIDYITFDDYPGSGAAIPNLTLKRDWTIGGVNTVISTTESKFGDKSVYLPGTDGHWCNTVTEVNDALEIYNTEPFTAEFFFRPDSTGETVDDQMFEVFGTGNGNGIKVLFLHSASPAKWRVSVSNSNVWTDYDSGSFTWDSLYNTWNHLALVKENETTTKLYINGVAVVTASGTMPRLEEARTYVGSTASGLNCFKGWIDDIFITKYKMYDSNFSVRTGQYIANQTVNKILFPLDTDMIDVYGLATGSGGSITTVDSKWGTGSLDLTGAHGGFVMPSVDIMAVKNKEFCVEFWYNPSELPVNSEAIHCLFSYRGNVMAYTPMYIYIRGPAASPQLTADHYMEFPQHSYGVGNGNVAMTVGNWYHIAYVRSPTRHALFFNGTRVGIGGSVNRGSKIAYTINTTRPAILGLWETGWYACRGRFSDFRWTIGDDVYDATQSTITIPTGPLT